jgi:hypothetical protein
MKLTTASLLLTIASVAASHPEALAPPAMGEGCLKDKDVTCGVSNESVFLYPLMT